ECQVLMMRLKSDLLEILLGSAKGDLSGIKPVWHNDAALSVVMATKGYPGSYNNGSEIGSLEGLESEDVKIFHAGTLQDDRSLIANGGRVLNVTAMASSISEARKKAYEVVEKIDWNEGFWRTDIGKKATKDIK
ncbi:Phosphoribosylamine--glycine ligase, partial [hydrothermal vent metagenome]